MIDTQKPMPPREWLRGNIVAMPDSLPMQERVRRYARNIEAMRDAGFTVPYPWVDTLDPRLIQEDIERYDRRYESAVRFLRAVGKLPDDVTVPSPFLFWERTRRSRSKPDGGQP